MNTLALLKVFSLGICLATGLVGCGGGGGSASGVGTSSNGGAAPGESGGGSGSGRGSGSGAGATDPCAAAASETSGVLSISLSAAPIAAEFEQAIAVIRQIRLKSTCANEEKDVLVLSFPREVDLLKLANVTEPFFTQEVPVDREYYAVELELESLTLVRRDGSQEAVMLGASVVQAWRWWDTWDGERFNLGVWNSTRGLRARFDVHIPLDVALHDDAGVYTLSPFAWATHSGYRWSRLSGTVDEVMPSNEIHEWGAFTLCNLQPFSTDASSVPPHVDCVLVTASSGTAYFDADARAAPDGLTRIEVNDVVTVYGAWNPAAEPNDGLVAAAVATGNRFEHVQGAAADLVPTSQTFPLHPASSSCEQNVAPLEVGVADTVPVLRENFFWIRRADRDAIKTCLAAGVEGTRTASDALRSFVVVLQSEQRRGVLARPSNPATSPYELRRDGVPPLCIATGETWVGRFNYLAFGPAFELVRLEDLLDLEVTVTGVPRADGCFGAERIVYVE